MGNTRKGGKGHLTLLRRANEIALRHSLLTSSKASSRFLGAYAQKALGNVTLHAAHCALLQICSNEGCHKCHKYGHVVIRHTISGVVRRKIKLKHG